MTSALPRTVAALALTGALAGAPPAVAQSPPRLTLGEAIRLGLDHAPRLEGARAASAGAREATREASSRFWPSLGVEGQVLRFEEPMIVAPLHAIDLSRAPAFERTLVQSQLALGYTLFDGGERGSRGREAAAAAAAADARVDGAGQRTVATVVAGYVEVIAAAEGLAAEAQRVAAVVAERDRVERFLHEGRAARVERLRADAALALARSDSGTAAARLEIAVRDLARLLGVSPARTAPSGLLRLRASGETGDPDSLATVARRSSPALREAEGRVEAARAAQDATRAAWWPTVRVEGRAITYGARGARFTTEWQTGVRLTYPLFTGGRRGAASARAAALTRELETALAAATRDLIGEVDRLAARAGEMGSRRAALEEAVVHLAEVARTEALALREGAGTQADYLRAEAELAAARARLADATALEVIARTELVRATGHLTPERVETLLEVVP